MPASYARGGARPAVTDADLVLGKLEPTAFAGGRITLDPDAAARALDTAIGAHLRMRPQEAAFGVTEVVDENMAIQRDYGLTQTQINAAQELAP